MKKIAKWFVSIGLVLVVLVVLAALIIPKFIDVAKYKPQLEKRIAEVTGRPFAMGGELELSLFPRTRLTSSDIELANLPGFGETPFLSVGRVEVRLKPLPLLSGKVVVELLRIDGLKVSLQRNATGKGNWEKVAKPENMPDAADFKPDPGGAASGYLAPVGAVKIEKLAIVDASVSWLDMVTKSQREFSGIDLSMTDLSLERAVGIALAVDIDGRPVTARGSFGPLGALPGRKAVPMEMALSFLDIAHVTIGGTLGDPAAKGALALHATAAPFSLRQLAAKMGIPMDTADSAALNHFSVNLDINGSLDEGVRVDGHIEIDDSRITLAAHARNTSPPELSLGLEPELSLGLEIDRIDLDRYLPVRDRKQRGAGGVRRPPVSPGVEPEPKASGSPLLGLPVLAASLSVADLTVNRMLLEDLRVEVSGKQGIFDLSTFSAGLYGGRLDGVGRVDAAQAEPHSRFTVKADGIQAGPLLRALSERDVLEGNASARASLAAQGVRVEDMIPTLAGDGELVLTQGVIKGVDLAALMRVAEGAFDVAIGPGGDARTEFGELRAPFRIDSGRLHTEKTTLTSPAIAVTASGTADLAAETLDFRIVPQVAYRSAAGEGEKRTQVQVAVVMQGSFSAPVFRPDVSAIAKDQLEQRVFESREFKKLFESKDLKPLEESTKQLLRGLLSQ